MTGQEFGPVVKLLLVMAIFHIGVLGFKFWYYIQSHFVLFPGRQLKYMGPSTHKGDLGGVSASWLQPVPAPATADTCSNKNVDGRSYIYFSNRIKMQLKKLFKKKKKPRKKPLGRLASTRASLPISCLHSIEWWRVSLLSAPWPTSALTIFV